MDNGERFAGWSKEKIEAELAGFGLGEQIPVPKSIAGSATSGVDEDIGLVNPLTQPRPDTFGRS